MARSGKSTASDLAKAIRDRQRADAISLLIQSGCKLRSAKLTDDPLMAAVGNRDLEAAQLLLEAGAVISPEEGSNLLTAVITEEISLRRDEPASDPITLGMLDTLMSHGVDINAREGTTGHTALRLAALYGKAELVHWLLDRGADPFVMDRYGRTPRDEAETSLMQKKDRAERLQQPMWLRAVPGLEQSIALLNEWEGRTGRIRPLPPSPQDKWPILKIPVHQRRGMCDRGLETVDQIMIRAQMDDLASFFEKQADVMRVERDVLPRKSSLMPPPSGLISLIKLKGQPWVYVRESNNRADDSTAKEWSARIAAPLLHFGAQDTSGLARATLYRDKKVEAKVQSHGSDWSNVDDFLKRQDAYLSFVAAGIAPQTGRLTVTAYFEDEALDENIERVDLIYAT